MRKTIIITIFIFILIFMLSASVFSESDIKVMLNNNEMFFLDVKPVNTDGRVLVPARAVFEALKAEVSWDEEPREVSILKNGEIIRLTIDSDIMSIGILKSDNEFLKTEEIALDVPAKIINGRAMLPLRAVSEAMKLKAEWNGSAVFINDFSTEEAEGWVYYSSWSDNGRLYKVDTNGQNRQKLSDYDCYDTQIHGNHLYYRIRSDNSRKLYRIGLDGSDEMKVSDSRIYLNAVIDDKIYYCNLDESVTPISEYSGKLYRMDLDCKNPEKLSDDEISFPAFYNGQIYYGDFKIYKMDLDGQNKTELSIQNPGAGYSSFAVKDGWIYFSGMNAFCKVDTEGNNLQELCKIERPISFNIANDNVITIGSLNGQDDFHTRINIMGKDGSNLKKLEEALHVYLYEIHNGWVYYSTTSSSLEKVLYRIDYNGDNKTLIFDGSAILKLYDDKLYIFDRGTDKYDEYKGSILYISDLDGSNLTKVSDYHMRVFNKNGDTMYFTNADEGQKLYKIGVNGENAKRLTNDQCFYPIFVY